MIFKSIPSFLVIGYIKTDLMYLLCMHIPKGCNSPLLVKYTFPTMTPYKLQTTKTFRSATINIGECLSIAPKRNSEYKLKSKP